jgi:PAS domain-containing protein
MGTPLPAPVLRARLRLMLAHPYLAAALARLPLVNAAELPWCNTMATDGYYVYVNPSFCEELSEAEIIGVFAHEVLHCVLGHIDRRKERQRLLWNMAIDYATNLLLRDFGFTLPKCGLYDVRYRGMTAEQIYDQMIEDGVKVITIGFDLHVEPGDAEGAAERAWDFPSPEERRICAAATSAPIRSTRSTCGAASTCPRSAFPGRTTWCWPSTPPARCRARSWGSSWPSWIGCVRSRTAG